MVGLIQILDMCATCSIRDSCRRRRAIVECLNMFLEGGYENYPCGKLAQGRAVRGVNVKKRIKGSWKRRRYDVTSEKLE